MVEPGARIHIWLFALSDAQTSLRIWGKAFFASIDFPSNPCEWMSTNEANVGCWYPPLLEPLLAGAAE